MSRPYDHEYLSVIGGSRGAMSCGGCGQPITDGEYRSYRRSKGGDWRYVTHHRACCEDDAGWAKKDAQIADDDARMAAIALDVEKLFARHPAAYADAIYEEVREQAEKSQ